MPINSYLSPPLGSSATSTPPQASSESGSQQQSQQQPGIQRLNSHSSQNSATDRRRRGSSLGNLFSTFTSSLRQQPPQPPTPVSGTPVNGSNQITNNSSSVSIASSVNGIFIPPPISHQASTTSLVPSHTGGSGHSPSNNNNNNNNNNNTVNATSETFSLQVSPTFSDIHQMNPFRNLSTSSVPVIHRHPRDVMETDDMGGPLDDLEEENEEQARTRQNSMAVTPALAESVNDKREPDGSFSIRLTPFIDHSSSSPALYFSPLIRKLKPGMRLPVGRYTEKNREAAQAPQGSSAGLVFKSKVVSRTHLEILVDDHGNWYIKDLKSSSGTFLNHIRLSPAGVESDDCMVCDGDILQLGMDFRGGSEEIFRCVKVRIELNKSWKRKTHKFNRDAHKKLLGEETECCICLNDLRVGDSIFISPCSHSWHYKCVRPLLVRNYPQFHCPNCRSITDLEEDDDDD